MALDYKTEYQKYKRYYLQFGKLYSSRKEVRAYVNLGFAFLALAFFTTFAIRPALTTIAGLWSEIKSQEEVDLKLSNKVEALRLAYTNYSQIQGRLELLNIAGTELPLLANFMRQIEALSAKHGVVVDSISFEETSFTGTSDAASTLANFSMSLSGSYGSLNNFLTDTENLRRVVSVQSFTYTKSGETGGEIRLLLSGGVLYIPPKPTGVDLTPTPQPVDEF